MVRDPVNDHRAGVCCSFSSGMRIVALFCRKSRRKSGSCTSRQMPTATVSTCLCSGANFKEVQPDEALSRSPLQSLQNLHSQDGSSLSVGMRACSDSSWINNCVGARNQKHFFLFLLYVHIGEVLASFLGIGFLWLHRAELAVRPSFCFLSY